jgi:hypothetical protein
VQEAKERLREIVEEFFFRRPGCEFSIVRIERGRIGIEIVSPTDFLARRQGHECERGRDIPTGERR